MDTTPATIVGRVHQHIQIYLQRSRSYIERSGRGAKNPHGLPPTDLLR